jgi:protein involved in polysaccharide export with SLBB domain
MSLANVSKRGCSATVGATLLYALCGFAPPTDPSAAYLRGVDATPELVTVVADQPNETDYRLGLSDRLRVTVYGEDDLSGAFQIDSAGFVRLPLIGEVHAAGLTARQLEAGIANILDGGYLEDARVAVEVTEYRPFFILGQVGKPGQYPCTNNMSALNAIALAGGFTQKAVESTIYVRHAGEAEERAISIDQQTRIYPGDIVRVPETAFWSVMDVVSPVAGIGYASVTAVKP